jgi:hypothetical protein
LLLRLLVLPINSSPTHFRLTLLILRHQRSITELRTNATHNMAGGLAMNTPSVISGWTAFGAPVRKSNTPPADDMETTTAPTPQDLDDPDGDQEPAPTSASPASQTQEAKDLSVFRADSREITGYILLDLCERHSTSDIVDQINQAAGAEIISRPTLNSRLNSAMVKKAKDEGTTKDEVRAALTERRKARGIRSTRRRPWAQQRSRLSTVTNASDFTADAANTRTPTGYSTEENSDADMGAPNNDGDALAAAWQQEADHAAFVDQQSLKGDAMLLMAERYTDVEISARICAIPGNYPLKEGGVANRIHDALKRKAQATGTTLEQVRADLNAARASNGIVRQTKLGKVRAPKTARKAKSEAVVQDDAADDAPVIPAQEDDEMTDDDGTSSQQGWNAAEVDAANTLLSFFSDDSEVDEAASTLIDMHRADASLGAQPKQVVDLTGEEANDDIDDVEMARAAAMNATEAFNANANANATDVEMTDTTTDLPTNTQVSDKQAMYAAQEAYLVLLLAKSKRGE